jgi:hypothetical protein
MPAIIPPKYGTSQLAHTTMLKRWKLARTSRLPLSRTQVAHAAEKRSGDVANKWNDSRRQFF